MTESDSLQALRVAAGITQAEMAQALGLSQSQVSRYEENPDEVSMKVYRAWQRACGFGQLAGAGLSAGAPYEEVQSEARTLVQYLADWREDAPPDVDIPTPANLALEVHRAARSPYLALSGKFDAGKTRLLLSLLGIEEELLPSSYAPTTKLITVLIHERQRPAWLGQPVAFFAKGFDPARIHDPAYAEPRCLAVGDFELVGRLVKHRTIANRKDPGTSAAPPAAFDAEVCVLFLQNPALELMTAVDFPGIGSGNLFDAEMAARATEFAEAMIYMSPAAGFLGEQDLVFLPQIAGPLTGPGQPALEDLFIVASQARQRPHEIATILDEGARRLQRQFAAIAGPDRSPSFDQVRSRTFSLLVEDPVSRSVVEAALTEYLGQTLPLKYRAAMRSRFQDLKRSMQSDCVRCAEGMQALQDNLANAAEDLDRLRKLDGPGYLEREAQHIRSAIARNHSDCQDYMLDLAEQYSNPAYIEPIVRYLYKNEDRKEAEASALATILEKVRAQMQQKLVGDGQNLQNQISDFLKDYEHTFLDMNALDGAGTIQSFDVKDRFMLAMSGTSFAIGAGAALFMFALAMPGAPIIAVGMATIGLIGVVRRLVTDWQTALAQKIAERLRVAGLSTALQDTNRRFWRTIGERFEDGLMVLQKAHVLRIDRLEGLVGSDAQAKVGRLQDSIAYCRSLNAFLEAAPWPAPHDGAV